jgi:3-isopropylmalate/(R)-2-methylmalate dehydratase small subunit
LLKRKAGSKDPAFFLRLASWRLEPAQDSRDHAGQDKRADQRQRNRGNAEKDEKSQARERGDAEEDGEKTEGSGPTRAKMHPLGPARPDEDARIVAAGAARPVPIRAAAVRLARRDDLDLGAFGWFAHRSYVWSSVRESKVPLPNALRSLNNLPLKRSIERVFAAQKRRSRRRRPRERGFAMEKFTTLTGVAAPLPMINVDTDKIIPKQHLKTVERTGLGKALFEELRYLEDGKEHPDFVLNQPAYRQAKILVAGENFGCGSSREHAPWALMDFGIRCVIAPSFADIFYNNSFKNGMLLIKLPPQLVNELMEDAKKGANARLSVDLAEQTITRPDGEKIRFELDPHLKHCLLNGLDDIGLTLQKETKIASFEVKHRLSQPWL